MIDLQPTSSINGSAPISPQYHLDQAQYNNGLQACNTLQESKIIIKKKLFTKLKLYKVSSGRTKISACRKQQYYREKQIKNALFLTFSRPFNFLSLPRLKTC